ncbi:ankyrin repeat-containing domain protein [Trichoderma velutinum]
MTLTEDLLRAAENGDSGIFRELLETLVENEDINSHEDKDGNTPLMIAAKNGRKEIVQLLLTKYVNNVNINAENTSGDTPLSYAAEYRHKDVVEILLQYTKAIWPPVYQRAASRVAAKGHEDMLNLLLGNDNIGSNEKDRYGSYAIISAAKCGKTTIVKHLLGRSDINLSPDACHVASIEGTIKGHINVIELLLERNDFDINAVDRKKRSLLIEAALYSRADIMKKLLARNDINVNISSKNQTALDVAMDYRYDKVVKLLLTREDLNLDAARVPLSKVIRWANDRDEIDLRDSILAKKSSEPPGRTPISWSAEHDEVKILKILLSEFDDDLSSKANMKDHDGRTPLSRAAEKGHSAAVYTLIDRDADVNFKDRDGRTPLWLAIDNGHEKVAEQLVRFDNGTLLLLTQEGKEAAAIYLISLDDLKLNQTNNNGQTALHLAAILGHREIARHLILRGAEIDREDNNGTTPLQLAMSGKHESMIQELLYHKADIKDIAAKEWREAYNKPDTETILLSKTVDEEHYLEFPPTFLPDEELSRTSATIKSRLYLLTDDSENLIWSRIPTSVFEKKIVQNTLQHGSCNLNNDAWDIWISLQLSINSYTYEQPPRTYDTKVTRVMWRVIRLDPNNPESPWIPVVYFSTLPYGWIPDNELHLFRQFSDHLKTQWLDFCNRFENHLSRMREVQLESKGAELEIINLLAKDAQRLAQLRNILAGQIFDAEKFIKDYCLRFRVDRIPHDIIRSLKDEIQLEINQRIQDLDQSVRDLLQFEFAWITIRETRIATKVGQNVMLLTYQPLCLSSPCLLHLT